MQLNFIVYKHPTKGYCKAHLTISAGIISKINILEENLQNFEDLQFFVTPGFVNSHLHPNQLFDRRLLDGLSITKLLHQMHGNYHKTEEDRYVQALFVLMDAIQSGATSIYSVASNPLPVIKAYKALGLKGAVSCFYNDQWEGHGDPPSLSAQHAIIEEKFKTAFEQKTKDIDIHIGSASIQSASNELLVLLDTLAKKHKTKVNIHASEGIESVHTAIQSRGCSPIRLLSKLKVLSKDWNLIHAVNIDEEEVELIAKANAKVIHCPVSNAKTGVGIAPIKSMLQHKIVIGLGTDACSNNNTNHILNEAYFASLLQSAYHQNVKVLPLYQMMNFLTHNGYVILGSQQKGIIEEHQPADLLLWELNQKAFTPVHYGNFESALIYNAPDVRPHTVLISGNAIVDNYQFKFSETDIIDSANMHSQKIVSMLGNTKEAFG